LLPPDKAALDALGLFTVARAHAPTDDEKMTGATVAALTGDRGHVLILPIMPIPARAMGGPDRAPARGLIGFAPAAIGGRIARLMRAAK